MDLGLQLVVGVFILCGVVWFWSRQVDLPDDES